MFVLMYLRSRLGEDEVRDYVAGVRLHRVTDRNRTFAEWWADFEVVGVDRDAMITQIGNNVFAAGFSGVASVLA